MADELKPTAVRVCPERDIECGSFARNWCAGCPNRRAAPSTEASAQAEELPPLPKSQYSIDIYHPSGVVCGVDGYTADDMQAYARAAIAADRASRAAEAQGEGLTDDQAWQLIVDLFGTTLRDTRYPAHVEIESAAEAGELVRAIAAHLRAAGQGGDGELMRFAKWIVKRGPDLPDHACAECVPHSDMLKHGFKCVFHGAAGLLHESATKGEKGGAGA